MILVVCLVAISSFGLGLLTAAICLSTKTDDLLYDEAKRIWHDHIR